MATRQRHLPSFALPIVFVGSNHSLTGSFPDPGWVLLKMLRAWEVWPGVFSRVLVAGRMSSSVVPNPLPQSDGQDRGGDGSVADAHPGDPRRAAPESGLFDPGHPLVDTGTRPCLSLAQGTGMPFPGSGASSSLLLIE
jgi:hypothetical protein